MCHNKYGGLSEVKEWRLHSCGAILKHTSQQRRTVRTRTNGRFMCNSRSYAVRA